MTPLQESIQAQVKCGDGGMKIIVQLLTQAPCSLQGLNGLLQPQLIMVLTPWADVIRDLFVYGAKQHVRSGVCDWLRLLIMPPHQIVCEDRTYRIDGWGQD